jgi:hypothetical protein
VDETKSASFFANNQNPFSLQKNSRDSVAYAEKKTLPRVSVGVSQSVRVATIDKVKNGSAFFTCRISEDREMRQQRRALQVPK